MKDYYLLQILQTISPEEIIFFTDGNDAIFMCEEDEIITKFSKINVDILFSAETNCYPCESLSEYYGGTQNKYKYLNSGGFIGKCKSILEVLNNRNIGSILLFDQEYSYSNQYLWTQDFLSKKYNIMLDYDCQIFQTFAQDLTLIKDIIIKYNCGKTDGLNLIIADVIEKTFQDFEIQNHRLFNKLIGSYPCHLHFNSPLLKEVIFIDYFKDLLPWS